MSTNLLISIKFLLAKKRSMAMSLCGIAFGVGFLILTQGLMTGFQEFFIKTILGTDGAIRISDRYQDTMLHVEAATKSGQSTRFFNTDRSNLQFVEGVEYPDQIEEAIQTLSNIAGVSSILAGGVSVDGPLRKDSAEMLGIDLESFLRVTDLEGQIVFGSISDFRDMPMGLMIGKKMADRLGARVGDSVPLYYKSQVQRFVIAAIYETGRAPVDKKRIFAHIRSTRSLLGRPHGVSFMQIAVHDRDKAVQDSLAIEAITNHAARPYQDREKTWLEVFRALEIMAATMVTSIILVSGLGMFNTLAMIVMEKTREIAILRSMGYTRRDISVIFLLQGAMVLIAGAILGFLLGAALTFVLANVPLSIRGIFTIDKFPVLSLLQHYIYAALTAVVIVAFASWAPARRAAALIPGDVIRGTSS